MVKEPDELCFLPTTIDLVYHKVMDSLGLTLETLLDFHGSNHLPILVTALGRLDEVRGWLQGAHSMIKL